NAGAGARRGAPARRVVGGTTLGVLRGQDVVPEVGGGHVPGLLPGDRRPGQVQILLAARHRGVEKAPLVLRRAFEARLPTDAGAGQEVPDASASNPCRWEAVPE